MDNGNEYIKSFGGLRFLAILVVFFHHFDVFSDLNIPGYSGVMKILYEGFIGVNFFYILSGFVITYSYEKKLIDGKVSNSTFLFNRISKLYPVHILLLFTAFFLYGGKDNILARLTSSDFISSLLLLQSYVPIDGFAFGYNGVAWSISTELFFYVAFIFIIKFTMKERKSIYWGLLGIIIFNCIVAGGKTPISGWLFYINPLFRLIDFLTGMFLCDLYRKRIGEPKTIYKATMLEVASILIVIWFVIISINSNIASQYKLDLYYLLPVSWMIYIFSFSKGYISNFLSSKVMLFLGNCSFAFYMAHQIVLYLVKMTFKEHITSIQRMVIFGMVGLIVTIIVASVLHLLIEKPVDKKLRALWNDRKLKKIA